MINNIKKDNDEYKSFGNPEENTKNRKENNKSLNNDKQSENASSNENVYQDFVELEAHLGSYEITTSNGDISFVVKESLDINGIYIFRVTCLYRGDEINKYDMDMESMNKINKKDYIAKIHHDINEIILVKDVKKAVTEMCNQVLKNENIQTNHESWIHLYMLAHIDDSPYYDYVKISRYGEVRGIYVKKLSEHIMSNFVFLTMRDTKMIYAWQKGIYLPAEYIVRVEVQRILQDETLEKYKKEVIGFIKDETLIEREYFNQEVDLINFKNGILDINTFEFREATPDDLFTYQLDVDYDPEALCPNIDRFTHEILPDNMDCQKDREAVLEFIGLLFVNDMRFRKAMMLTGDGKNGKSVLIHLVQKLLGKCNYSAIPIQKLNKDKFAVHNTYGKLANICADLPSESLEDVSIFKQIVGGDDVDAEQKYHDSYTFTPTVRLFFSANQIPYAHFDGNGAYFDRWNIIHFPMRFEGKSDNKNLKFELESELPGFVNLVLRHYKTLVERGEFANQQDLNDVKKIYMLRADHVYAFFMDCVLEPYDKGGLKHTPKRDMYAAYIAWCEKNDVKDILSDKKFSKTLKAKRFGLKDRQIWTSPYDGKLCWENVLLNDTTEHIIPPVTKGINPNIFKNQQPAIGVRLGGLNGAEQMDTSEYDKECGKN
jgi:putative DNA primase/helicase